MSELYDSLSLPTKLTWYLVLLTNSALSRVYVHAAMCKTAASCSAVSCTLILMCSTLTNKITVLSYVASQHHITLNCFIWDHVTVQNTELRNFKHLFAADLTTEVNKNETDTIPIRHVSILTNNWHPCISFLCNISGTYQNTHIYGTSTESALSTYDKGTMIRYGPLTLFFSIRYVISAIVWIVFPRPISSARIPFRLLLYRDTSHSRP
jgi:hypothetical protein